MAETKTGVTLTALCLDQTFIRIDGPAVETASGMFGYPWTQMIPVAAGGWEASLITGTADVDGSGVPEDDPAIESTGNDAVPADSIVIASRVQGTLGFMFRACGA
jgi:hypothetical protein